MLPKSDVLKVVMVLALVCVAVGISVFALKDKPSENEFDSWAKDETDLKGGLFLGFGLAGLVFVYMNPMNMK